MRKEPEFIMNTIYVFSSEHFCGKTAISIALGNLLQTSGFTIGYFKPVSYDPVRRGDRWIDEDTQFVRNTLYSTAQPDLVDGIFMPAEQIDRMLEIPPQETQELIKTRLAEFTRPIDVLIIEGNSTFSEGHALGVSVQQYTSLFGCCGLLITRYQDDMKLYDTTFFAKSLLGEHLRGMIINRIPQETLSHVREKHVPFIEKQGIPVFATIPEDRRLLALTVNEIIEILHPQILTRVENPDSLVENLTIGAMNAEAALSRFRKQSNKAVITGGDRTDIQLAALETSTTCLILTGNLHPNPIIVRHAEESGIPIFLVPTNTMETIEQLEGVIGKTRLGQPHKLNTFLQLFNENVALEKLLDVYKIHREK